MDNIAKTIAEHPDLTNILKQRAVDLIYIESIQGESRILENPQEAVERLRNFMISSGINVLRGVLHTLKEMGYRECRVRVRNGLRFDIWAVNSSGEESHLVIPYAPDLRPEGFLITEPYLRGNEKDIIFRVIFNEKT